MEKRVGETALLLVFLFIYFVFWTIIDSIDKKITSIKGIQYVNFRAIYVSKGLD